MFRLDSGSNVPLIYGGRHQSFDIVRANTRILKRFVNGVEQDFAALPPTDVSIGRETIPQVIFVQTMNSIGVVRQAREDGVLPTQMFRRVFVSYTNQFAVLDPK